MQQGEIINDLEGFFSQNLQLNPPTVRHKRVSLTIVCIAPFCWGGRVEPPTTFSKVGGLTISQFLEGACL